MGAGSSIRVHAEAAFNAADTDKDSKLTPQELGAMLREQGLPPMHWDTARMGERMGPRVWRPWPPMGAARLAKGPQS